MNKRPFDRIDYLCAGIAGLISLAVYVFTAAPNVTLLDSGEFLVAAEHFGVAHPTGYPLWTLLSWLFQFLPLGNVAWEISLFSGICGALAVALCALMSCGLTRWLFGVEFRLIGFVSGLTWSLLFAFSQSQWSQAVIVEVYALHALLTGLFLLSLYLYILRPESLRRLLLCFFLLSLAFSNHHLTLVLTPLPFLAVLLLQRRLFWDLVVFSLLTAVIFYLFFAIASDDTWTIVTALRFFFIGAAALAVFLYIRRLRACWTILAFLPFVVFLGLLPYAYMPLASLTNPPMNWGYTRTAEGLFYSFNRTQYYGSLSEVLLKNLGRITGTSQAIKEDLQVTDSEIGEGELSLRLRSQRWVGFFWQQLAINFTPFCLIAFFSAIFGILRCDLGRRTWIYLLTFAFVLAAFLQPILDGAEIDLSGWWLQMPYHTYTNLAFALLCSTGTSYLLVVLSRKRAQIGRWAMILLLLPVWTFFNNYHLCSQRDRWFGWQFGHDMLRDLPKGSVIYGGTDPGRFVPTYMIFGESPQSPRVKRDPDFDRQDLYIITQNALGDRFYRSYIRDHYSAERPKADNAFERWLGREHQFPEDPLILPSDAEAREISEKAAEKFKKDNLTALPMELTGLSHTAVAQWIFEKNRDKHEFFVEESFPMRWSYDHAVPHGLIYRINKEPIEKLSPEDVAKDKAFWGDYIGKLLADPGYAHDFDAQRSFSKLRVTQGNIYRYRKMNAEAEHVYEEALRLWPANGEAIAAWSALMWERNEFERPITLFEKGLNLDPNNRALLRLGAIAVARRDLQQDIQNMEFLFSKNPRDLANVRKLLGAYTSVEDTREVQRLADRIKAMEPADGSLLGVMAAHLLETKDTDQALEFSSLAIKAEQSNPELWLLDARVALAAKDKERAAKSAVKALQSGGLPFRERIQMDPRYKEVRSDPDVKDALGLPLPPPGKP